MSDIVIKSHADTQLSKNYYTIDEVCPDLNKIYDDLDEINKEVRQIMKLNDWVDWPESDLYDGKESVIKNISKHPWTIYPLMAFNTTAYANCERCPKLWAFIQSIPGVKLATLSKLDSGVRLNTHQGWGNHSNNVIRCHFGFDVPDGCCISVREDLEKEEEIKLHHNNEWLLFDDSRHHYAHNPTDRSRVILIVDVDRPKHIKKGTSEIGDTKELIQIIDYFKKKNVHIYNSPIFDMTR